MKPLPAATGVEVAVAGADAAEPGAAIPRAVHQRRQLASEQLFAGLDEIEILHGHLVYRLRRTQLGKLILTK